MLRLPSITIALLISAVALFSGCDKIEETAVDKLLLGGERELVAFYNLPPDTSIAFDEADSLYNYMNSLLEHYENKPEACHSRTYFEDDGRAVTYYFTHDTLHHITYGQWEQIAPDSVYMYLTAVFGSTKNDNEVVVADGNFRVERLSKGTFTATSNNNRAQAQLDILPLLTAPNTSALPSYTGVFEEGITHIRTQILLKRVDDLEE